MSLKSEPGELSAIGQIAFTNNPRIDMLFFLARSMANPQPDTVLVCARTCVESHHRLAQSGFSGGTGKIWNNCIEEEPKKWQQNSGTFV